MRGPDNANNVASSTTTVISSADLAVVKSDSPDPVAAGAPLTYTIVVSNAGPSTAAGVSLSDALPAQAAFVSAQVSAGGGVCVPLAGPPAVLDCALGSIDPGGAISVTVAAMVKASVPNGTVIGNTASVLAVTPDPNPGNNSDTEQTTVIAVADLWLDKAGGELTGNPSRTVRFTLTVNNLKGCEADDQQSCGEGGPSDAQNVTVVDTLPLTAKKVKVVFVSQSCSYDQIGHQVTCQQATVPAGSSVTFLVDVQFAGSVGDITNTATVSSSTTDPVLGNNTDLLKLKVKGGSNKPGV